MYKLNLAGAAWLYPPTHATLMRKSRISAVLQVIYFWDYLSNAIVAECWKSLFLNAGFTLRMILRGFSMHSFSDNFTHFEWKTRKNPRPPSGKHWINNQIPRIAIAFVHCYFQQCIILFQPCINKRTLVYLKHLISQGHANYVCFEAAKF